MPNLQPSKIGQIAAPGKKIDSDIIQYNEFLVPMLEQLLEKLREKEQ